MKITRRDARITLSKPESRLWFAAELAGSRYGNPRDVAVLRSGKAHDLRKKVLEAGWSFLRETRRGPVEVVATDDRDRHAIVAELSSTHPSSDFAYVRGAFGQMAWPNPTFEEGGGRASARGSSRSSMTRAEINAHPSVVPALEAWRAARREAERVELDRRYSHETQRAARAKATAAERVYDAAVAALLARRGP